MDTQTFEASATRTLTALVARATLAPSTHNTQPWHWVVHPDCAEIELAEDVSHGLPVNDPGTRELVLSCGAALLTLRVAAAEMLLRTTIDDLPDPARPALLARVRLEQAAVDAEFAGLDAVIARRRTAWHRFTDRPLPDGLAERLAEEVAAEGAHLTFLDAAARARAVAILRDAAVHQARDAQGTRELLHLPSPRAALTDASRRWRVHTTVRLVGSAPAVAVLWTDQEDHAAWLRAGQALQRGLLVAAEHGVLAGYANAACQVPDERLRLAHLVAQAEGIPNDAAHEIAVHPQVMLRLGFPLHRPPRTPRRPVGEVLDVQDDVRNDVRSDAPAVPADEPDLAQDWSEDDLG